MIKRGHLVEKPPLLREPALTPSEIDRDLQRSVSSWIDERRLIDQSDTAIARARLRAART